MGHYDNLCTAIRRGFDRGCDRGSHYLLRHCWYIVYIGVIIGALLVAIIVTEGRKAAEPRVWTNNQWQ